MADPNSTDAAAHAVVDTMSADMQKSVRDVLNAESTSKPDGGQGDADQNNGANETETNPKTKPEAADQAQGAPAAAVNEGEHPTTGGRRSKRRRQKKSSKKSAKKGGRSRKNGSKNRRKHSRRR